MKTSKKIVAIIMTLLTLMSICSVAMPVFAQEIAFSDDDYINEIIETEEATILSEDLSKREENVKHFIMSDGSFIAAQYDTPIHYVNSEGEWVEYDNSLSEIEATEEQADLFGETELYTTGNETKNVVFAPKSNSNTLVAYEAKDYPISLNYQSAKKSYVKVDKKELNLKGNDAYLTLPNISQEVIYEDVFNDVDLQYIVTPSELKENIILKSNEAENEFTVNYNIGELTAEIVDSQTINLKNNDDAIIYTISAPYMYDSNGVISEDVTLNVDKNKNGKLRVNISADSEWLQNEKRVYPVVIDPTITTETTQSAIDSVFVANNSSYLNRNFVDRMEMLVGRETSAYGYCRSLFKFELPALNKGDMVVAASLNVKYYSYEKYADTTPDLQVNAHLLKSTWDKTTVTWNDCPDYVSTVLDYQMFGPISEAQFKAFDISSAVKQWYEGESTNYGILLKSANESGTMAETGFKAYLWTERYNSATNSYPRIAIIYRNNKGLEDYWTYTTLSAGTAGTAYINDYTGNLVFIHGDVATTGELMPVSLEHVYNGYMANSNASTYPHSGRGNKLSLQQTVKPSGDYGLTGTYENIFPYAYEDGDGTVHFFYKETKDGVTKYLDEDGLNLELKVTSSGYTITDKSDNVMTFNSQGYLKTIADAEGRTATLTYRDGVNTANKTHPFLYKITDGAGHTITLDYNTGNGDPNGNNQLKSIKGPDGKIITYETSGGCVTKITYPDGNSSTYTYNEDKTLATARSADGYMLTFTYTQNGDKRVKSVEESYALLDRTVIQEGQKIEFERKKLNQTVIRTAGKDAVFGNDDDIKTTYQFDNFGRTVSTKMRLVGGTSLGAEKYSYTGGPADNSVGIGQRNRVSSSAASGKNVTNLLVNHSMENSGSWTSLYWMNSNYNNGSNSATLSGNDAYLGNKAIKLNVGATADANGGYSMYQNVSLTKGATYTLSGYIKTSGVTLRSGATKGGACLAVRFATESGTVREMSNMLNGTTDTAIDSGWQRISYTFKVPSDATSSRILAVLHNATGTAYFDCLQLEKSDTANSYNLLENASFENEDTSWTAASSLTTDDDAVTEQNNGGSYSYRIKGAASADKYIRQTVNVNGSEKDTYILSGYAKANSIPIDSEKGRRFDFSVRVTYDDGSSVIKNPLEFNDDVTAWQYSSGAFTLSDETDENKTPQSITVYCGYRKQENTCYFDDISLIKEPSPTYSYDDDGNLVSATENAAKSSALSYDSNDNLESFTDEKNSHYTYDYATSGNKHRLLSAKSNTSGITYAYSYYDNGTLKAQEITNDSTSKIIRTGYTYTEADSSKGISAGAYVKKERDQHKHDTTYTYDLLTGRVTSVKDANENVTEYEYDADNGLVKSVTSGGKTVSYDYNNAGTQLKSITHNGFKYNFVYDNFGNVTQTKVGSAVLMTNTYQAKNGNLTKSTYGNGDTVEYTYNAYCQTTKVKKNGADKYLWTYNSTGMPYQHTDLENDRIYTYDYDSLGRVVRQFSNTESTGENRFMSQYTYDVSNNVTKVVNFADGNKVTTNHTYDAENRPTKTTLNSNVNYEYTYDHLGRLNYYYLNLGANEVLVNPVYYASERNTDGDDTYQTTQIQREEIGDRGYAYTYDNVGNIKTITEKKNSTSGYTAKASYDYDDLGQLIRENNIDLNQTIEYTYDNGGNLESKEIYDYSTELNPGTSTKIINYYYDDAWKDKLTGYTVTIDGETAQNVSITYDQIGNPLTYRDGMSFTWNGRQMATANLNGTAVTYKYDADGLRSYKKVVNTVHEYEYVGGQLVYEKRGDLKFYYRYNAMGELASIKRVNSSGTEYTVYAVTNTRGDIEELRLASGTRVARYVYDTWGNTIGILDANGNQITDTSSIAVQNPFRYRSYYYDAESGLYYLQSRYYDPVTCRFVNADDQLSTQSNNTGWNLFCYGGNNPVNNIDPTGHNFIKNGIKFIADKIIKPIVKGLQKVVSKKDATYSVGFAASGTIGLWSLSGQAGISVDTKGNVAIQASGSGGVTTSSAGFSATLYRTKTNAPNVNKLNGPSCQVGGSISVPIGNHTATIGGELNIIPDDSLNKVYLGDTFNVGLGFGSSLGEFHVEWGGTIPVGKTFNMFDVAKSVYIRIMEW